MNGYVALLIATPILCWCCHWLGYQRRSDEIIREIHAERDLRTKARIKAKR